MSIKIAFLGDISFNGKFNLTENKNVKEYLFTMSEYLEQFDYVIGNLESPMTTHEFTLTCKGLHLKTSPVNVELLNYLHINVVDLANNHLFDYGRKGYDDTIRLLNENNIDFYGVEGIEVIIEKENSKIALGGYCCLSTNPSVCNAQGVNPLDPKAIRKRLNENEMNGYMNMVSVHWGDEYIHYPRYEHVQMARSLADKHAIVLHGHHPHVIQGIEEYNSSLMAYSLGNFCMDDIVSKSVKGLKVTQEVSNRESFIWSMEVENNKVITYHIVPIVDNGESIELGDQRIVDDLLQYSEALKMPMQAYVEFRKKKMDKLIVSKPRKRDFKWILNRLNYYYIGAVIKGVLNKRKYNRIMKYLK